MQAFRDLNIAAKLILGFILVLLLTTFLGLFSIYQLSFVSQSTDELGNDWMPSAINAMGMKESISRMRSQEAQMASATTPEDIQKYHDRTNEAIEGFKKYHADLMKYADQPNEKKDFEEAMTLFNAYVSISNKITQLAKDGNSQEAMQILRTESSESNKKLRVRIDQMVEDHVLGGKNAFIESQAVYLHARIMIISVLVAAIVLGMFLAVWLARLVSKPLQKAVDFAHAIAAGDLTHQVKVEDQCETGQLLTALSEMNTSLLNIVNQVREGSEQIKIAATEVANGNMDLSSRTESQASSLEETAASMEEITSTINHNSDNARQANVMSKTATDVAEKGGNVVAEVVSTMSSINESSRKIVDIISVIDGIAFQTNILALNAAVEAARAGEQGRGFAVVASEVRSLAQRSASAAKEIKELISDSVDKVGQGSRLVDAAGSTMHEVVESVKRVSDIISEITAAGAEQSTGVSQINMALSQMDHVTQQNAALVEEAAAASASMQQHAANLVDVVSVFNTGIQTKSAGSAAVKKTQVSKATVKPVRKAAQATARIAAPAAQPVKSQTSGDSNDWEEF